MEIVGVWVDPAWRGRGIGSAIANAVIDHAREQGVDRIWLFVAQDNRPAIELYRRLGFVDTGVQLPFARDLSRLETEMVKML